MRKAILLLFISSFSALSLAVSYDFSATQEINKSGKLITLIDNEIVFENISSQADSVGGFLQEWKIDINDGDYVFPEKDAKIFPGSRIIVERAKNVTIATDGKTAKYNIYGKNVASALWENKINLGEDDFTKPALNYPLQSGDKIEVIRVDIREEIIKKDIPYGTKENEDDKLSWRTRKITQKGEKGIKEITYKVVSYNSKEISRKVLKEEITKDPVAEIVTQGTYVKLGKASKGDASYYASSWGELNASRSIPLGGFAKVTNLDSGKSVIVKINDYGPRSSQRIIDLSCISFSKIGDLGQGVLHNVKVEQILN